MTAPRNDASDAAYPVSLPRERRGPVLLRGAVAIGAFLSVKPGEADHLHRTGAIPTFRVGGTPYATHGALAEWMALQRLGRLPQP